jgi:hypothetical protein
MPRLVGDSCDTAAVGPCGCRDLGGCRRGLNRAGVGDVRFTEKAPSGRIGSSGHLWRRISTVKRASINSYSYT